MPPTFHSERAGAQKVERLLSARRDAQKGDTVILCCCGSRDCVLQALANDEVAQQRLAREHYRQRAAQQRKRDKKVSLREWESGRTDAECLGVSAADTQLHEQHPCVVVPPAEDSKRLGVYVSAEEAAKARRDYLNGTWDGALEDGTAAYARCSGRFGCACGNCEKKARAYRKEVRMSGGTAGWWARELRGPGLDTQCGRAERGQRRETVK